MSLIEHLEDEFVKFGFKVTVDVRKFIQKLDFSKEVFMRLSPKCKKVDVFTTAIVLALLRS